MLKIPSQGTFVYPWCLTLGFPCSILMSFTLESCRCNCSGVWKQAQKLHVIEMSRHVGTHDSAVYLFYPGVLKQSLTHKSLVQFNKQEKKKASGQFNGARHSLKSSKDYFKQVLFSPRSSQSFTLYALCITVINDAHPSGLKVLC